MPTSTIQLRSTPDRGRPAWLALIQIPALIDSAFFFKQTKRLYYFRVTLTSHITANASGMKRECLKSHLVNIICKKSITDIILTVLLFTWPFVMLCLKALKSTPFMLIYCAVGFIAYMDRIRFVRLPSKKIPMHKHVLSQIHIKMSHHCHFNSAAGHKTWFCDIQCDTNVWNVWNFFFNANDK